MEYNLAKVGVAGSSPVTPAIKKARLVRAFFNGLDVEFETAASVAGSRIKTTAAPVVFTARGEVLLVLRAVVKRRSKA